MTALLEEALNLWRALDWPLGQHMALVNLGLVTYAGGDPGKAEAFQQAGLEVRRRSARLPARLLPLPPLADRASTSRACWAGFSLRQGEPICLRCRQMTPAV